ncbi:hypothetical protein CL629_04735 [bacterium]|nr:hypothetical protein [bacterium]|tara:strand:- start:1222 stop:1575 length:354 start_codon:yes stop_codon:yes gene_type:complete
MVPIIGTLKIPAKWPMLPWKRKGEKDRLWQIAKSIIWKTEFCFERWDSYQLETPTLKLEKEMPRRWWLRTRKITATIRFSTTINAMELLGQNMRIVIAIEGVQGPLKPIPSLARTRK